MPRRIIAVALPWLVAEHRLRAEGQPGLKAPFAVIAQVSGALRLAGINRSAAAAGLSPGMALSDARAICPALLTRTDAPERREAFLSALTRWAERFSPLVGTDQAAALMLDATGAAHLFGGEAALLTALTEALAEHGLTGRAAMADTKGAAWALAHFGPEGSIAPPGGTRQTIGDLPTAALRLEPETADALARVGLTTIEPLTRMPRGGLARRFGLDAMRRLDQALGAEPEPVAPERPLPVFAVRMTLPEPVALVDDVMAGLERLLERLCARLAAHDMGARRLVLTVRRVDSAAQHAAIGLARPGRDPMRLRALFERKVAEIEAGFGIDALRLSAPEVEALRPAQLTQAHRETEAARLADLISRLGNRVGFERLSRLLPAESHIPEHAVIHAAAAHADPGDWTGVAATRPQRPITLFRPEPVTAPDNLTPGPPPQRFTWRRQHLTLRTAHGPERLAPEWWWDDPDWRTGPRDYWRIATEEGPRLWLFQTPAAARPAWYAHGTFA